MRKKGLTLRVVSLVVAADVIEFVIMVSFKKVSLGLPPFTAELLNVAGIFNTGLLALESPYFWSGIGGMIASFIIWPAVLAALDLSVAFPLGSLSFVFIPILSIIFLGEEITPLRWVGILIITSGIAWLSVTEKQREVEQS